MTRTERIFKRITSKKYQNQHLVLKYVVSHIDMTKARMLGMVDARRILGTKP